MKRYIGIAMMAAPFVVLLGLHIAQSGLLPVLAALAGLVAFGAWIWVAIELVAR